MVEPGQRFVLPSGNLVEVIAKLGRRAQAQWNCAYVRNGAAARAGYSERNWVVLTDEFLVKRARAV